MKHSFAKGRYFRNIKTSVRVSTNLCKTVYEICYFVSSLYVKLFLFSRNYMALPNIQQLIVENIYQLRQLF